MDTKVAQYRALIEQILSRYEALVNRRSRPEKETFVAFDEKRDHYFLHSIGWENTRRIWNTTVYVRIRDGKFYIEIDWTEEGIATDLLAAGVPKEDIVLAFHHPSVRPYTEFAVA
jgi:hypothetical protein